MTNKDKLPLDLKWSTRQRLRFIEVMAYYTGIVTRSDVARAFGISDPAATKDLKLYGELAPGNLIYTQAVFGFVPAPGFRPVFADLSPAAVLPLLAANLAGAGGPYGDQPLYGLTSERLPLPGRLPSAAVLAQITRAMRSRRKLAARYHSLTGNDTGALRILEPHALVDTGLRWHVRAYSADRYEFRDFVLSRFAWAECLDQAAESDPEHDEDWVETLTLRLAPHQGLDEPRRQALALDYGARDGVIELTVRRALVGYLLQRLMVDTSRDHSGNPRQYQLMLENREEVEPFAAWALG
ncbi:helix-turn-helix transcriptional regulator [Thiobacter aerophilum]|uniref:WYL domain-containing protein n=1 Tax=Thiobacter aerophilum TaxID=3121275 RepID=A0ABV0EEU8_9BURK